MPQSPSIRISVVFVILDLLSSSSDTEVLFPVRSTFYVAHILLATVIGSEMGTWPKPANWSPSGIFSPKLWKKMVPFCWEGDCGAPASTDTIMGRKPVWRISQVEPKGGKRERLSWIKLFLKPNVTLDFPGTQMKISPLLHKLDWVGFLSLKMEDSWPTQDSKCRWSVLFAHFLPSQ